jgi:mono/diheme cytochrome c family protein
MVLLSFYDPAMRYLHSLARPDSLVSLASMPTISSTEGRPDAAAMKVVAHNLTPEEIKAVAAYVSTIASK